MPYYAITDSDWDWDDDADGSPYIIQADTPEQAADMAAHRLLVEDGTADGCHFKVSELVIRGFIGCVKTGPETYEMDGEFIKADDNG